MKILFQILLLTIIFVQNSIAQGIFFIGDNTYPCTKAYKFPIECFNDERYNNLKLFFVKDGSKGMVVFEKKNDIVCGTILFYLEDNSIIKLYDKNKFDFVNGIYSSIYYLTASEIEKLKKLNINTIRYNIAGNQYSKSLATAQKQNNIDKQCSFIGNTETKRRYNFPAIITEFYK